MFCSDVCEQGCVEELAVADYEDQFEYTNATIYVRQVNSPGDIPQRAAANTRSMGPAVTPALIRPPASLSTAKSKDSEVSTDDALRKEDSLSHTVQANVIDNTNPASKDFSVSSESSNSSLDNCSESTLEGKECSSRTNGLKTSEKRPHEQTMETNEVGFN